MVTRLGVFLSACIELICSGLCLSQGLGVVHKRRAQISLPRHLFI